MRLKEVEQASGIRFNWRPFHLLIILQEMKHVPFADKPAKAAYMWRDIERRATMYGIPAALPAPYPAKQSIVANLVATVGMRQGWGTDFVRAAYRRWFQLGHETGSEPNVSESLREIGQEPQSVLALANAADTKNALGPARVRSLGVASRSGGLYGSWQRPGHGGSVRPPIHFTAHLPSGEGAQVLCVDRRRRSRSSMKSKRATPVCPCAATVRNASGRRRWSKLRGWLSADASKGA